MNSGTLKYTTSSLIAAGALAFSGAAYAGGDKDCSECTYSKEKTAATPTQTETATDPQLRSEQIDVPSSSRAGQWVREDSLTDERVAASSDTRDDYRVNTNEEVDVPISSRAGQWVREDSLTDETKGKTHDAADHDADNHKHQTADANPSEEGDVRNSAERARGQYAATDHEQKQRMDKAAVQQFDGKIIPASAYLTGGDMPSQDGPMLFISSEGETFLLIEPRDAKYLTQQDELAEGDPSKTMHLSDIKDKKMVNVEGRIIERSGLQAIVLNSIEASPQADARIENDPQDQQSAVR